MGPISFGNPAPGAVVPTCFVKMFNDTFAVAGTPPWIIDSYEAILTTGYVWNSTQYSSNIPGFG